MEVSKMNMIAVREEEEEKEHSLEGIKLKYLVSINKQAVINNYNSNRKSLKIE